MSDQRMEYYSVNAKLCRLVQANPCMYDRSSPNYLKKEHVERAWANIANEVKDSVGSCKERWRNIRTAFARSVNIYKTHTGPNRHKRYYLHDELQFLRKHITPGLPSLPIRVLSPTELEENHENSRQSIDQSYDNYTYQITIDSLTPPPPIHTEEENEPSPEPEYTEPPSSPVAKRKKIIDSEDLFKDLINRQRNKDLDADFLHSILPEMKAMNARQKILFKGKIFQALEEVFDDTKDFPNRVKPPVVESTSAKPVTLPNAITTAQILGEQRDISTIAASHNLNIPMITLNRNEGPIKQEPICVDLFLDD